MVPLSRQMSFLFKSKGKSPSELSKLLKENLTKLTPDFASSPDIKKTVEENTKIVLAIKTALYGDEERVFVPENAIQMCNEFYQNDLLYQMLLNIPMMEFETRKEVVNIMCALLKRQIGPRFTTADFLGSHSYILELLFKGYENEEIALNYGIILRECLKFDNLTQLIIESEDFWKLFSYIELPKFHLSSDAFATLREALIRNKYLSSNFVASNYENFMLRMLALLNSDNYILKRQSLKLLGELLIDRAFYHVMIEFVKNVDNLKIMMNLLKDSSKNIQLEAYHVFKLFVFNPRKPKSVADVLYKNQSKLTTFLESFGGEKNEEETFLDEKQSLIAAIHELKEEAPETVETEDSK